MKWSWTLTFECLYFRNIDFFHKNNSVWQKFIYCLFGWIYQPKIDFLSIIGSVIIFTDDI